MKITLKDVITIAATTVYSTEEVVLQDDAATVLTLKPLPIKTLRKFMAVLETMSDKDKIKSENDGITVMLELATLCITKQAPKLVADQDALEEALDMPTVYKIIEVCGGIKLNDPNLLAAATGIANAKVAAGTN
jgi:hypothetical protein